MKLVENALKASEKFLAHQSLLVWNDYEQKIDYDWQ